MTVEELAASLYHAEGGPGKWSAVDWSEGAYYRAEARRRLGVTPVCQTAYDEPPGHDDAEVCIVCAPWEPVP